jgi:hypothetical protein
VYEERRGAVLSSIEGISRAFAGLFSVGSSRKDDWDMRVNVSAQGTRSRYFGLFVYSNKKHKVQSWDSKSSLINSSHPA